MTNKKETEKTIVSPKYGDSGHTDEKMYNFWLIRKKFGTLEERYIKTKGRGD